MKRKRITFFLPVTVLMIVLCCAGCAKDSDNTASTTKQTAEQTTDNTAGGTNNPNLEIFQANCGTIRSAIATYQAGHNGQLPKTVSDLDSYISGGFNSVQNKPSGATYLMVSGAFFAVWETDNGAEQIYTYPATGLGKNIANEFKKVVKDAKLKTFEINYRTMISVIAMYRAANRGSFPKSATDVDSYINGGLDSLQDNPSGATYIITGTSDSDFKFIATYTDEDGETHIRTYPSD